MTATVIPAPGTGQRLPISLPASDFRNQWTEMSERVAATGDRFVLHRYGKPMFAVVPVEDVETLVRVEELAERVGGLAELINVAKAYARDISVTGSGETTPGGDADG